MRVDAILLDAGGVFLLPDFGLVASRLRALGIETDASRYPRAHYSSMRAVDLAPEPPPYWRAYTTAFVAELGITGDIVPDAGKTVNRAFVDMEWDVLIEPALAALPLLAERAQLAIVSNSDGTVERLLRGHGIGEEMVAILDSHLIGIEKPDPRIFEMALVEIGVPPDRAVHVGDSVRFDVIGARNAGVRPIHLDPFDLCDENHDHITSLLEVTQLI
ncbi:MAG: HAD family hydrolase [Actinomycetota bacterium]